MKKDLKSIKSAINQVSEKVFKKEKKDKKGILKRFAAASMAVILGLSGVVGVGLTKVNAASAIDVYITDYPRSNDEVSRGAAWGHGALTYMNGWTSGNNPRSQKFTHIRSTEYNGPICYCIEPGISLDVGDTLVQKDENYWDNYPSNSALESFKIREFVGRIMLYGYQGNVSRLWVSQTKSHAKKMGKAIATQLLIWEVIVGERDTDFNHITPPTGINAILDQIASNHPVRKYIMQYYNEIVSKVQSHVSTPSFMAKTKDDATTVELQWDGTQYTTTLTDTNNVLSKFSFYSSDSNVKLTVSGNKLIVTTSVAPTEEVTISASKKGSTRVGTIVWGDGKIADANSLQDVVAYGENIDDPVPGYIKVNVSAGSAKIIKTSEDGVVEGISFTITGNGVNQTVTTGENGEIQVDNLAPGEYTIAENSVDRYVPQESQKVTIVTGKVETVTFNNTLKRGSLSVTKNSEDGLNSGVKFHLYGTSLSGLKVDEYAVTNESGVATFSNVLIGTNYTLEEVDTAVRYVVPDVQNASVEWNKSSENIVVNTLKKFRVTVTKTDKETGTTQGNATLAGAVYGIYKGDELVDKYTTDANGQFTTNYYICGDDWSIREISPSEGYLLDETSYHVGAEAKLYTIEKNDTTVGVTEEVIKGKISINKHTDDGKTQIEIPEEGAEFAVYLKSAGSYDNAKESERDYLVCDENGYAETKDLPYGIYTVTQTKSWEGKEIHPDFDVTISEDGKDYRYIINNATMKSLVEIVKKDIETGKIIPVAGIGFKVLDCSTNEFITQHINYPTSQDVDVYYTDSTGKLMLPAELPYGKYELIEVQTANGYVLDSEPVEFTVDGTQEVVTVEKHNMAQKGKITIAKSGEVFSSVTESNKTYQPIYEVEGLKGATYEVTAAEDIITVDGTKRYNKGDVVATVTTGDDGKAVTESLYLGKYEVREIEAPYGMVLSNEVHQVELAYAGQEVEITETSTSFVNERQRVQIDLSKSLEQDNIFGIGMNNEVQNVSFGIYASEDLTATDGSVIPKNGLIEIATCDESGKLTFTTDLPFGNYYVKEYATDSHYIVSVTDYPITFDYAGQETAVVNIPINNGESITNDLIRGKIVGKKINEEGNVIEGAVFGLFKEDETDFTVNTALLLAKSDANGEFVFEDVPYGTWIVRELEPTESFVLNETSYPVTVSENEETIEIEIENKFIRGSVKTTKVDADYPDHKLTGAMFEIYADVDGDKDFNPEIDTLVGEMYEIEAGVYLMDDLKYGGYFLYEAKNPEGYIKDDAYYYFEITENDKTVIIENEAGKGFINQPIKGEIEITKKDIVDGKLLANAGFRIKDENGNIVVEGYTDNNGIAKFTLGYGKYTYEEFDAPDGYVIDTTPYEFEITENGQIIKAEMTNEGIPETGESNSVAAAAAVGSISALLSGLLMLMKKRYSVS